MEARRASSSGSGRERVESAPAKVNLGLRLIGRREDGYHLLESVFVPLDLADDVGISLNFRSGSKVRLACTRAPDAIGVDMGPIPTDDRNLAVRAVEVFLEASGESMTVDLRLCKRIPVAAGLGGGSSDAGAVLRGLAFLLPGAVNDDELAALALSLGADVPYFLNPRPAWVTGIGEKIQAVKGLPALHLVLASPGQALSTREVFSAWDASVDALTPVEPGSTMRALSALLGTDPRDSALWADRLSALLANDLLSAAQDLCPSIEPLRVAMKESGALATGMSGSGATIFGIFSRVREAEAAINQVALGELGWARLALTGPGG